jgi:phosphate transport system permease protein
VGGGRRDFPVGLTQEIVPPAAGNTGGKPSAVPPRWGGRVRRVRVLGLSGEDAIRIFFGGNAVMAVVVLALITYFLFRESAGFVGQNRVNLELYRRAGLEYVDLIRAQADRHAALERQLTGLRAQEWRQRQAAVAPAAASNGELDRFAAEFGETAEPLRQLVEELSAGARTLKARLAAQAEAGAPAAGRAGAAADGERGVRSLREAQAPHAAISARLAADVTALLGRLPAVDTPETRAGLDAFAADARAYVDSFPAVARRLAEWDPTVPVAWWESFAAFLFGREWLTASFWQDWYGVIPLLVGSLLVAAVALALAVPLGVGAAIYVSQMATPREQRWIKPGVEFISVLPSVVLGFFGIAVLGEALRALSQLPWLAWVPGFPFGERLNILTAGCLLALMAVPTIFTLAEESLGRVPRSLQEASAALGASRWQTTREVVLPSALSGMISAVLLGFGRVLGETMVVLLCAGNRIAIPDFTHGLGFVFEPVHTMTGLVAQEMGEVVRGSLHYRALFMVGLVLFVLSLVINYAAQAIVRRYRPGAGAA